MNMTIGIKQRIVLHLVKCMLKQEEVNLRGLEYENRDDDPMTFLSMHVGADVVFLNARKLIHKQQDIIKSLRMYKNLCEHSPADERVQVDAEMYNYLFLTGEDEYVFST